MATRATSITTTDDGRFVARVRVMVGGRFMQRRRVFQTLPAAEEWASDLEWQWRQDVTHGDRPTLGLRRKGGE